MSVWTGTLGLGTGPVASTLAMRMFGSGADTRTASEGGGTAMGRTGARGCALARFTSLVPSSALPLAGAGAGAGSGVAKGRLAAGARSDELATRLDGGGGAGSFGGVCGATSFCGDAGIGSGVDAGVTGSAVEAGMTGSGAIAS